jgi:histidyl-tRNA synthetase
MNTPQLLKGFRDFTGRDAKARAWVVSRMRVVFERYGFEPLETPALEYEELLLGKYGAEAEKLVYRFTDNGDRRVAMRYDQTVPMARVIANNQQTLPMPYKRYQMQPVWRADKPQRGRYREFLQCDADIIGTNSALADAEIVALFYTLYRELGLETIQIKLNDRQSLIESIQAQGVLDEMVFSVIQTIDKLDKATEAEVVNELVGRGMPEQNAKALLDALSEAEPSPRIQSIIESATALGVPKEALQFTPTLARGLDYYTGLIFEGVIPEYTAGSVGGGGRYDNLINDLAGIDAPAVGFAIGFDRTLEALTQLNILPVFNAGADVVICYFEETKQDALRITSTLRSSGINTSIYMGTSLKMDKQLKYADRTGARFAVIVGENEMQKGMVIVKNLIEKSQQEVAETKLLSCLAA